MKWLVYGPQKLASFLQQQVSGECSGKQLRRALEANLCRVNGRVERFASARLQKGDQVELAPSWKTLLQKSVSGIETLFEDEYLKIVNKPANWVCSPEQALRSFGPKLSLVHRLDKDTTGALLLAKGPKAKEALMDLFETQKIRKFYLAVVDGIPKEASGVIENTLVKKGSFEGQTIWGSGPRGLSATTHWKRLAKGSHSSLLLCQPLTGRTHQIRVHLAEMGHPILVDRQYAKSFRCPLFIQRPLLHALRLTFIHPFLGTKIDINAPLFVDIREVLRDMGIDVRHFGQLAGEDEHDESRNQSHRNENAEEVIQPSHFLHKTCQ